MTDVSQDTVATQNRTRTLSSWMTDHSYDGTDDIIADRALHPMRVPYDDTDILTRLLNDHRLITLRYECSPLQTSHAVVVTQPSISLVGLGGPGVVEWHRNPDHKETTLKVGDATHGSNRTQIANIWFAHAGRDNYNGSGKLYNADRTISERLTGDQSHIELWQAGDAYISVSGFGCPHFISIFGGNGISLDRCSIVGGVWDPEFPAAQEAFSQIRLTGYYGTNDVGQTVYRQATNVWITNPYMQGLRTGDDSRRTVTINDKTATALQSFGPLYGLWVDRCEDWLLTGGHSQGFAHSNVAIIPSGPDGANFNGRIIGMTLDESNIAAVYARCDNSSWEAMRDLIISDTFMNGQMIGQQAIQIDSGAGGTLPAVHRLRLNNVATTAHLAAAVRLSGVDGGQIRNCRFAGYNMIGLTDGAGGAVLVDAVTQNLTLGDIIVGGGINRDMQGNAVDANGLSPNGTKYGLVVAPGSSCTYWKLRELNFGVAGGALNVGGTLDSAP